MRATSLPTKLSQKSLDTLHEHQSDDIPPIKSAPLLGGLDNNRGFRRTSYMETNSLHKSCDITTGHKQLNQYILYDVIGKGAYGKVRKAFWPEKNKFYAVKIINKKHAKKPILRGPRALAQKEDGLEKIRREFAIWKKLQHPNIVCLKEVIDAPESEKIYMISELIEGRPLLDGESTCTPLNEDTAKHCFCQLIEGLDFLHFHKIIHRDIKPTNLLFSSDGIVKITDFGQSQVIQDEDDYFRQTVGTGPFLAPEMLTGGAYKGLPIDLWAAGVTLFLFIYGHLPFQADTLPELYEKIKTSPVVYDEVVAGHNVNPLVINLLQGILEKNPDTRFTTKEIRAHPWLNELFLSMYPSSTPQDIPITNECVYNAITPLTLYKRLKRKTKVLIAANKFVPFASLPALQRPSTHRHIRDDALHHINTPRKTSRQLTTLTPRLHTSQSMINISPGSTIN